MKRREFLSLIVGAMWPWPLTAEREIIEHISRELGRALERHEIALALDQARAIGYLD